MGFTGTLHLPFRDHVYQFDAARKIRADLLNRNFTPKPLMEPISYILPAEGGEHFYRQLSSTAVAPHPA
jgi:hypothetical protein